MAASKRKRAGDGLDDVYLGDFEGFVARRDALAKQLKADGDDQAAAAVKALRKPSRTAWAVNQFAAHGKKLRAELLKAGADLRGAQEGLVAGDADRQAMIKARDRERAAVTGALEAIEALADEAGAELTAAAAERVRQTLHAVALDDEVRARFESARMTTDHEATGIGGGAGARPRGASAPAKKRGKDQEAERRRRRREELRAAEADAAKRDRELEAAELELREAKAAAKRAQGDLDRAAKRRERAKAAADDTRRTAAALASES